MTPSDRFAAKSALADGKENYTNLDRIREPGEVIADIINLWKAVEQAMQAMLGGSSLSGDALVREVSQKGLINLQQANSLISFWDVRSRADQADYTPTLTDISKSRKAYEDLNQALDEVLRSPADATRVAVPEVPGSASGAYNTTATSPSVGKSSTENQKQKNPSMFKALGGGCALVVVAVAAIVALMFWGFSTDGSAYEKERDSAIALMQSGDLQGAQTLFGAMSLKYPGRAEPKVFLARVMRHNGQVDEARTTLIRAIELEPKNVTGLREMGLLFFSIGDFEKARTFFTNAIKADPTDRMSLGYMGCSLVKLDRKDLAANFFARAGDGEWMECSR